jgi:PAS domain S-box-containing protein
MAVGDRVIAWRGLPLQDDDDRIRSILVTAADVTDRRRAREEQRASERKLRSLANAMPQLVWMADADGTVTYYNRRVDEYAGLTRAADGSWEWSAVVHPDESAATVAAWDAARRTGRPYVSEHRLRMADGSWRWHLSRGVRGSEAQGDGSTWYGTATDIHDLKRTADQLRRSEERYRAFVANSSEGIWCLEFDPPVETALDPDRQIDLVYERGRFVECNDAIARMYGLPSATDLIGQSLDRFLPPDDPGSRAYLASIIENGYAIRDAESQEVGADGAPRWFLNGVSGVVEQGALVRAWGTQRDITELRRTQTGGGP